MIAPLANAAPEADSTGLRTLRAMLDRAHRRTELDLLHELEALDPARAEAWRRYLEKLAAERADLTTQ